MEQDNGAAGIHAAANARLGSTALRALAARSLFPWLGDAGMDWTVIGAALASVILWPHVLTALAAVLAKINPWQVSKSQLERMTT